MASLGGLWSKLTGGIVAFAAGAATSDSVAPALEPLKQTANRNIQARVLDAATAAHAITRLPGDPVDFADDAARNGIGPARFEVLRRLGIVYPASAELLELWRRDELTDDDVKAALTRQGYDSTYRDAVVKLFTGRLDPAIIATAIQRGIMAAPFKLPYDVNVPVGNVTPFPVSSLDTEAEAKASGIDVERLRVETALVGLPMALDRAAQARFRGILTEGDYLRAVLEGNARGEWAEAELAVARQILTAGEYAELELRGYYDRDARLANTGKHGMSAADSDLLYNVLGRSIAVHGVTTGLARGGKYPGSYANVPQPYRAAIQRSNIREEYAELAYANRYSYPSGFQIRAEAQKGDLTAAQTEEILLEVGWSPKWAAFFADKWTGGAVAAADPHVGKAATQLWTTTHSSYKAEEIDAPTATRALSAVGVAAGAIPDVLALWDEERSLIRKQLSPAQIKKAVRDGVTNPATGQPWSLADGIAALLARGYDQADAETLLAE